MAGLVVGRHRTRSRVGSGAARDRNLHAGQSADCPDLNGRLSPIAGQGVATGPQSPHGEALPHRLLGGAVASETTLRPVSYTHLRAHETRHDLVCRLLLEKKKTKKNEKLI